MSFGMFTCCFSRAYTAMEKASNACLYAVHVQPLLLKHYVPYVPHGKVLLSAQFRGRVEGSETHVPALLLPCQYLEKDGEAGSDTLCSPGK